VTDLDPAVRELAEALGVATQFSDWQGQDTTVPQDTVVAVLEALGVPAGSSEQAAASLDAHRLQPWRQVLPPTVVVRLGATPRVPVHVPHGEAVRVWVELEDGTGTADLDQLDHWVEPCAVDGLLVGEATFVLPADLPLGWHRLRAESAGRAATSTLVVTPAALSLELAAPDARAWGFLTQIYQVRSAGSWGVGDLRDLADLAAWSGAELGAGFVLVNPLHAASPQAPMEPSPYLPTTRRFASPLYLRVEDIPELADLGAGQRTQVAALHAGLTAAGPRVDRIDRDTAWAAKRAALELLAAVPLTAARASALAAFRDRQGAALVDFATWCALVDAYGPRWRDWADGLRSLDGAAVAVEWVCLAGGVELHTRLQWWTDEQLAGAQAAARGAGMPIGIVHDLAVGVDPEGFDSWALQDVLAEGVAVGAPPDAFNQQGQSWSQPPWRPDALAASGYAAYRDMLRAVLRHAGGIRVDHVLGLFRLWLVPDGVSPDRGTYLRQDHEALVGILALEAYRAGAVVIGEDLGTVEPWVRDFLLDRGIAGTSILWFERSWSGEPLAAEQWRSLCLASVTTHDLPPTAGYLQGEHLRIREELGLLTRAAADERAADTADRERWLAHLREQGLLTNGAGVGQVVEALHRYLVATPARLLGVSLPDAVGDLRAQNQPGTTDEYPNWRVPLTDETGRPVRLEDLAGSARLRDLVAVMADLGGHPDGDSEPAG
jgi:4-alpha-glucanotransferase